VDYLLKDTKNVRFMPLIEEILNKCQNSKVLITCRNIVNPRQNERNIKLDGLSTPVKDSWDLFAANCGSSIKIEERKSLASTVPDKKLFSKPYYNEKTKKSVSKIVYKYSDLGNHHFFELLGWNPQAIILTAFIWK